MGRWFRDKKSAGCAMCKYWKHGWGIKFKEKEVQFRRRTDKQIREVVMAGGVEPDFWWFQDDMYDDDDF
jgi:hypothetical protein